MLAIIYAAFISLGLPDAVVGAAWPSMHGDLGADAAGAAVVNAMGIAATIAMSFASGALLRRFGTFRVCAGSILLTATAMAGYAVAPNFAWLLAFAVPLGLGAGAIDTALNAFVAVRYSARHMNFLHASWGIGAAAGPLIVAFWLHNTGQWRPAYWTIAALQLVLFGVFLASRKMWERPVEAPASEGADNADAGEEADGDLDPNAGAELGAEACSERTGAERGGAELAQNPDTERGGAELARLPWYRMPNLPVILVGFFGYSAVEMSLGLWGATYLVERFQMHVDLAAAGGGAFFIGITAGRFVAGLVSHRLTNQQLLLAGAGVLAVGVALLFIPVPAVSLAGLAVAGFGCGPIFPMMLQETTARFGSANTERMMGIQMGFSYTGMLVAPPLVGLALTRVTTLALPAAALACTACVAGSVYVVARQLRCA
ncbi:Glucose/mannose:H(+) symporter [Trueperella bialowiezensis]|uniref:Glucose/mannose:H(+) symporter n=1 Tax=Trueperella bialowiezensis TaxID=312285 RepID=A0A448PFE1_9ACTO|nr:Glucose/mannose:H(+) symporter [Trueperella bialowiezensis]